MRKNVAAAALLTLAPIVAAAQPDAISYDYFHVGYTEAELDLLGQEFDLNGPELEASIGIGKYVYLFGAYASVEYDDAPNTDVQLKILGVGGHWDLREELSVYAGLGRIDGDAEVLGVGLSDDGTYVRAGVRFMPARGFEIRAGAERVDFDFLGKDTAFVVGGNIFLTDVVTLDLNYRKYDDVSFAAIGARFFFGNESPRARGRGL